MSAAWFLRPAQLVIRWPLEAVGFALLAVVIARYFEGVAANRAVVKRFAPAVRSALAAQFPPAAITACKSYGCSYFELFAGGGEGGAGGGGSGSGASGTSRKLSSLSYALIKFRTCNRQCFWRTLLAAAAGSRDVLEVEVGISPEAAGTNGFSLVVGPRVTQGRLTQLTEDLAECISVRQPPPALELPPRLVVLSDSPDAVDRLCTKELISPALVRQGALQFVAVSDLIVSERFQDETKNGKVLLLRARVSAAGEAGELVRCALRLAQAVASLNLGERGRERVRKAREFWEKKRKAAAVAAAVEETGAS